MPTLRVRSTTTRRRPVASRAPSTKLDRLTIESFVRTVSSVEINAEIDRKRAAQARRIRRGRERYTCIDAGYPRILWLVWDHKAKAVVHFSDQRFPWFVTTASAARALRAAGLVS